MGDVERRDLAKRDGRERCRREKKIGVTVRESYNDTVVVVIVVRAGGGGIMVSAGGVSKIFAVQPSVRLRTNRQNVEDQNQRYAQHAAEAVQQRRAMSGATDH